jgi:hypothetical protein
MFKLALDPTYVAPVNSTLPGDVPCVFEAVFRRLPQEEVDDIMDRVATLEMKPAQAIVRVLAGWRLVADEDGVELPFTPSNLSRLLAICGVPQAITRSWFKSVTEAREKN